MSEFEPIAIEHKPLFAAAYAAEPSRSSSDSFVNVYLWDLLCRRNAAWLNGRLGVEYLCPLGVFYAYPAGEGPLCGAVEALADRAREQGRALSFHGVTAEQRERLETAFPGRFAFTEDRANFDYLYSIDAFATLVGKKLHAKRNFCNRFEREHEWRFAPLTAERAEDCRTLLRRWDALRPDAGEEAQAIERALRDFDALSLLGGVLYADGAPVAFIIAESISPDTVDVHFEKADDEVVGAYPMIAREFARYLLDLRPGTAYLNREEDMGLANLRLAKEEWHPLRLLEKYIAVWRDEL